MSAHFGSLALTFGICAGMAYIGYTSSTLFTLVATLCNIAVPFVVQEFAWTVGGETFLSWNAWLSWAIPPAVFAFAGWLVALDKEMSLR